jgi:hypothetical protein
MLLRVAWLSTLVFACSQEQQIFRNSTTEVFYQEPTDEVDILWVVDNSQSMADNQAKVASSFADFIASLEEVNVDFNLGVITTDLDDYGQAGLLLGNPQIITRDTPNFKAVFEERVVVGVDGSDMEKGIGAAAAALGSGMIHDANDGFRRDGAALMINFVSDEDDCTDDGALSFETDERPCYTKNELLVPVVDLVKEYKSLKTGRDRMLVSAVVGPKMSESHPDCGSWRPGERYKTMANAFGGINGDICEQDFAVIMSDLGLQVSGLMTSFILQNYAVKKTIEVWVDEVRVAEDTDNGWTYDEEYHIVYFHGAGVPERGSTIEIDYEIGAPG